MNEITLKLDPSINLGRFVPTGEYRSIKQDEYYYDTSYGFVRKATTDSALAKLVVRPRTITRVRFVETGEIRPTTIGDWYMNSFDDGVYKAHAASDAIGVRKIFRREEFEEEVTE